jgi:hypothetical protein
MASGKRQKRHRKGKGRKRVPSSFGPLVGTKTNLPTALRQTFQSLADELGYTLSHAIVQFVIETLEGKSASHPTKHKGKR